MKNLFLLLFTIFIFSCQKDYYLDDLREAEIEIAELKTSRDNLKNQVDNLLNDVRNLTIRNNELEDYVEALGDALADERLALEDLQREYDSLKDEYDKLLLEFNDLDSEDDSVIVFEEEEECVGNRTVNETPLIEGVTLKARRSDGAVANFSYDGDVTYCIQRNDRIEMYVTGSIPSKYKWARWYYIHLDNYSSANSNYIDTDFSDGLVKLTTTASSSEPFYFFVVFSESEEASDLDYWGLSCKAVRTKVIRVNFNSSC